MEMPARILEDKTCHGILLDIGLPVTHRNVNYNCRVVCLHGKILFIRPKMFLETLLSAGVDPPQSRRRPPCS
ncbi:hypothetical protein F4824DRAFT_473932 [Ustulina deusta]|nr:hypothetical protein F4824DRAFT_473932 [Ustulina deusta]